MSKINFCDLERVEFSKGCFTSSGKLNIEKNDQTYEIKILKFNRLVSFLYLMTKPIASLFWVPVSVKIEGGECLAYVKVSEVVQKLGLLNQSKSEFRKELLGLAKNVSEKALTVLGENLIQLEEPSENNCYFNLGVTRFCIHITGSGISFENVDYTNMQDLFSQVIHSKIRAFNSESLRSELLRCPNVVVNDQEGNLSIQIFNQDFQIEVTHECFKCGGEEFESVQAFMEAKIQPALKEGYLSKFNDLGAFEGFAFENDTLSFKDHRFALQIDHNGIKWNEKAYTNIDLMFKDLYFQIISSWKDENKCIASVEKENNNFFVKLGPFSGHQVKNNFTYTNGKIVFGEESFSLDGFFKELELSYRDNVVDCIVKILQKQGKWHLENFNKEALEFKIGDQTFNFLIDFKKKGLIFNDKNCNHEDDLEKKLKSIILNNAAQKIKEIGTSVFSQWIIKYDQDFVAHAVFQEEGVKKIFESKAVFPSEYILRNKREVEYEQGSGYGERGISKLPDLSQEDIEKIQKEVEKLGPNYGFDLDEEELTEGKLHLGEKMSARFEFFQGLSEMRERYGVTESRILMAYEMQLKEEERFDAFLSQAYEQAYEKLKNQAENGKTLRVRNKAKNTLNNKNGETLCDAFVEYRSRLFGSSKLNFDIRTIANGVAWSYGHVAILRGKKEQVIGSDCGWEKALLPPWRNGGKFFALELEQEDTIVVGPRAIKEKYYNEKEHQNIKMVTFEEMTDEELDYLQVPVELYEK